MSIFQGRPRAVRMRRVLLATAITALPCVRHAAQADDGHSEEIVITGAAIANPANPPTTIESVTAEDIARSVNLVTPEDAVKYLPNILIRQRHIGDTQSPITTRTSGVGASARSLIYVDGVLLSALIGNNNTSASPKWGLISPDAIERVDVLYGPFAAAYAGNSIGTVVSFTTRMPTAFEANAQGQGAMQWFQKYADDGRYGTWRFAGNIGDALGDVSFRLSYNHLDNHGQPLTYATAVTPQVTTATGAPVTGAFTGTNRTGAPIVVLGATGIEHQTQDNLSGRAVWDVNDHIAAAYTFGLFLNDDDSTVNSYLRDGSGKTLYAGAVNIAGRAYTLTASTFSNTVYHQQDSQLAQGLSIGSHGGGGFDFQVVGSLFSTLDSHQRIPSGALPAAFTGGAGADTVLDGTGWYTVDATGTWRLWETHVVSFGAHQDRFKLQNPRYSLSDWISGNDGAVIAASYGRSQTQALWIQDDWKPTAETEIVIGGRAEHWRAFGGSNYSAAPALNVTQPELERDAFSPKLTARYRPAVGWLMKASVGLAYRFPTVSELYQAITTGATLSVPNPTLRPERALSSELSLERAWGSGNVRVSLFDERINDTLLSQTAPLPAGSTTLASYVQNVDRTHATGIELVARQEDILIPGLELSGWITYAGAKIDRDTAVAAAAGKRLPQLPRLRGSMKASYTLAPNLSFTLAMRYSDKAYGTIDNTDFHADTYQGFDAYLVADVHARYQVTPHLALDLGINNLNDRAYFLFHPFPQRTLVADLKYTY